MMMLKMIKRVILLPVILILQIANIIANLALNIGSYLMGPLMLFVFGCLVYSVIRQMWNHTFLLALVEIGCVLVFFGAGSVLILIEDVRKKLIGCL